jgi:NitT/TauT family transport system permease protein
VPKILAPYFIAKPSAIWESFLRLGCLRQADGFVACLRGDENNLWLATLVTLKNTWWGFLFGSASGIAAGLRGHAGGRPRSDRGGAAARRSEWAILRTVVVPSALAWVFASMMPAVSFALIGVIGGEFIGAERGLGKLIIEAEARANASEMMVAIFVMMVVGMLLAYIVRSIQSYLLRWQQQFETQM